MKLFFVIIIILFAGIAGYVYKNKFKMHLETLNMLKEYVDCLEANITLFKTNLLEIKNMFIIMQKNKNAKHVEILEKSKEFELVSFEILKNYLNNEGVFKSIESYFKMLGKNEYDFECKQLNVIKIYLINEINKSEIELKTKGDLGFKIALAIGAVLSILVWWKYGCFCFV